MRIALVYDAIFPYSKGGGERRFYEISKQMAAMGHDVHLYGMKYWDGPSTLVRDGVTLHGLMNARPLYTSTGKRSIAQALLFGIASFKLIGQKFDVIDCCGFPYFSLFPAKIAALIRGKKLFATWHEVWGRNYWGEYLGVLGFVGYSVEWIAARLPNTIIAVSDEVKSQLKTKLGTNVSTAVIVNGIDLDLIQSAKILRNKLIDILYVGRIMEYKNLDVLIKAVAILAEDQPDINCTIIGNGTARAELEALVHALGISKNIVFKDFMPDSKDIYSYMKTAKVFCLPSSREGFGMVALESIACGTSVVTVDEPDNAAAKLIVEGAGEVVKLHENDLAGAILRQLSSIGSPSKFADSYGWADLASKLEKVYEL